MDNFQKRFDHRMDYADYVVDSLLEMSINKFKMRRVYSIYDTFQKTDNFDNVIEIKDEKVVGAKILEVTSDNALISIKIGKKWVEINCPMDLMKFSE